jgi:hypothetical protein
MGSCGLDAQRLKVAVRAPTGATAGAIAGESAAAASGLLRIAPHFSVVFTVPGEISLDLLGFIS